MTKKKYITGNYIKSDLLIDLDGYNSPVKGEWQSGQGDYTFDASAIVYDSANKKYIFNSGSTYSKAVIDYKGSNTVTVQFVDDGSIYNNTSLAIPFESSSNFNNNAATFIATLSEKYSRSWVIANRGVMSAGYSGVEGGNLYNQKTLYTFVIGNGSHSFYINATRISMSTLPDTGHISGLSSYASNILYIGARNNSSYKTRMGLHAFRLYNRQLSEAEIQSNLTEDKRRFNF